VNQSRASQQSAGPAPGDRGRGRRVRDWLADSPDAPSIHTPVPATAPTPPPSGTAAPRPRKAERRAARRAAFYAERRRRAAHSPRALFEVATDQVRALDSDRAFTAATKALDAVIARYGA